MSDLISRMDALQACQVGPSDEWSRSTKSGYNQAATDCAMNILRIAPALPAVQPAHVNKTPKSEHDAMSDEVEDLVGWLLDWPYQGQTMAEEAAVLIKQLTAELRVVKEDRDTYRAALVGAGFLPDRAALKGESNE